MLCFVLLLIFVVSVFVCVFFVRLCCYRQEPISASGGHLSPGRDVEAGAGEDPIDIIYTNVLPYTCNQEIKTKHYFRTLGRISIQRWFSR